MGSTPKPPEADRIKLPSRSDNESCRFAENSAEVARWRAHGENPQFFRDAKVVAQAMQTDPGGFQKAFEVVGGLIEYLLIDEPAVTKDMEQATKQEAETICNRDSADAPAGAADLERKPKKRAPAQGLGIVTALVDFLDALSKPTPPDPPPLRTAQLTRKPEKP